MEAETRHRVDIQPMSCNKKKSICFCIHTKLLLSDIGLLVFLYELAAYVDNSCTTMLILVICINKLFILLIKWMLLY